MPAGIMPAGQKPVSFTETIGPFVGCRDMVELAGQDMRRAAYMLNCYIELPELGGDVMQRAGFVQRTQPSTISGIADFTGPTLAASPYITEAGVLTNLMLVERASASGFGTTSYFQVGAGKVYPIVQYDAPATYAIASYAGGTSSAISDPTVAANRIFQTALGPYAIFAQSGGKVRLFDYANGTILDPSDLTDDVFGRPCIYYGKAFFILESDRSTIVWSEENDPDIGYQASGYDNFWSFRQTSNAPLMGLAGTNQYLFVFRQNSITSIEGAVNSDFRSFGTLEGISTSVGTLAPDSIVNVNDGVWFLDQFCRPHAIIPGRGLVPLWENMRVTLNSADLAAATQFANWGRYDPLQELVIFRISMAGTAKLYAFSSRTMEWLGEWSYGANNTYSWGATLFDSDARPMLSAGLSLTTDLLTNFITQKANTTTDQTDTGSGVLPNPAPTVRLLTPLIVGDMDEVVNTRMVTASSRKLSGALQTLTVDVRGSNAAFFFDYTFTPLAPTTSGDPGRYVAQVGIRQSRWAQYVIKGAASAATARLSIGSIRVYGTKQRVDPELP